MKGRPVPSVLWATSDEMVNRATVMMMFFRRPVRRLSKSTRPPAMMPSTKGMASLGVPNRQTRVAAIKTLAKTGSEVMMRGLSGGSFIVLGAALNWNGLIIMDEMKRYSNRISGRDGSAGSSESANCRHFQTTPFHENPKPCVVKYAIIPPPQTDFRRPMCLNARPARFAHTARRGALVVVS